MSFDGALANLALYFGLEKQQQQIVIEVFGLTKMSVCKCTH